MKQLARIVVPIEYDDEVTDVESLATAVDILLETATSTPGILDDYGNPVILETEALPPVALED